MWNSISSSAKNRYLSMGAAGALMMSAPAFSNSASVERIIDLRGTTNTRDIGGYQTDDLRTIQYGQIIRSENLSRLTKDDFLVLEDLGVKTVIDLRSEYEHEHMPTRWKGENPPEFHHFPVGDAQEGWLKDNRRLMSKRRFSAEQALEHMVDGYRAIPLDDSGSYAQMMEVVLDESNWPILIHCTAGKDRSGIAVALIQEAVGVDRDAIMDGYLLTNEVGRSQAKAELLEKQGEKTAGRKGRSTKAEAWYPIVGVDAQMLEAFYASVDSEYGSMDAYLEGLGADPAAREALADSLTGAR